MAIVDVKVITFDSIMARVIDYADDRSGVIEGVYLHNGYPIGLMITPVPEIDPIQSQKCPECKAVDHIRKSYEKPFDEAGAGI